MTPTLLLNKNMIKREPKIGQPQESNMDPPDWLPIDTTIILSSVAIEKSYNNIYIHP